MKEEIYVDLSKYDTVLRKKYLHDLQELAFSKGIGWIATGEKYEPNYVIKDENYIAIYFNQEFVACNGSNTYLIYGKRGTKLDYRSFIKRLRSL